MCLILHHLKIKFVRLFPASTKHFHKIITSSSKYFIQVQKKNPKKSINTNLYSRPRASVNVCSHKIAICCWRISPQIKCSKDELLEWQKARDIDNPLKPWNELFKEEFPALREGEKPTYDELDKVHVQH